MDMVSCDMARVMSIGMEFKGTGIGASNVTE